MDGRTARDHETLSVAPLLDRLHALVIDPETAALDKGYDNSRIYTDCTERGVAPVIPLRQTPDVKKGKDKPPCCEHGEWRFAGADRKRNATKWRCSTGECKPASVWIKADQLHPLIPRETLRWKGLYRRPARPSSAASAGSRTNGRSRRCACAGSSAYDYTPILRSSHS